MQGDAGFRKITLDAGRRRRLQHLAVPAALPGLVDRLVTRDARLRADKRTGAVRVDGRGLARPGAGASRPGEDDQDHDRNGWETTPRRQQLPERERGRLHTVFFLRHESDIRNASAARGLQSVLLTARAESLAAFDERCIPTPPQRGCRVGGPGAGGVAPPSNTPGILSRHALPAGRGASLVSVRRQTFTTGCYARNGPTVATSPS